MSTWSQVVEVGTKFRAQQLLHSVHNMLNNWRQDSKVRVQGKAMEGDGVESSTGLAGLRWQPFLDTR